MSKGQYTRVSILEHATRRARRVGLGGLSIGTLAEELGLSKSGLFAHFGSKEALQIAVLETAREQSVEQMVRPALGAPRGEERVRALFERWLAWSLAQHPDGGCLFVQASTEVDDMPGPVREKLADIQRDWLDTLAQSVRVAVRAGHFRDDTDAEQVAFEMYGVMLMCHLSSRLLDDPRAVERARRAFDAVVARAHS